MPASEAVEECFEDMKAGCSLTERQQDDFYKAGALLMENEPWFVDDARRITRELQNDIATR